MLCDKVMYVAEVMNRHDYVPKMPNQVSKINMRYFAILSFRLLWSVSRQILFFNVKKDAFYLKMAFCGTGSADLWLKSIPVFRRIWTQYSTHHTQKSSLIFSRYLIRPLGPQAQQLELQSGDSCVILWQSKKHFFKDNQQDMDQNLI